MLPIALAGVTALAIGQIPSMQWRSVNDPVGPSGVADLGSTIATDGNTAVVGVDGFRVEVYRRSYRATSSGWPAVYETHWDHEATLTRIGSVGNWGGQVDVEGDVLVVGARKNTNDGEGFVDVYRRFSGYWFHFQRIHKTDLVGLNLRDYCCNPKLDGGRLLIGDSDHDQGKGVLFVMAPNVNGQFELTDTIVRPDPPSNPNYADWHFTSHVSVRDGTLAISTSPTSFGSVRSVYFYGWNGSSYVHEATRQSPLPSNEYFGVALAAAAGRVAVAQRGSSPTVFVYEKSGGVWPSSPNAQLARYASDLDFDGYRLVVALGNNGRADAFERSGTTYVWRQQLSEPPPVSVWGGQSSSLRVAIAGGHLLLGAPNWGATFSWQVSPGAVSAYRWHNGLCVQWGLGINCP